MSEKLKRTPCPQCGEKTLFLDIRLKAKPLLSYSLAGQQPKVSAQRKPYLGCYRPECDFEAWGHFTDDGHAQF